MTPRKLRAARQAAWTLALKEGRVVRYENGERFTSYPTVGAADIAIAKALDAGLPAERVTVA